MRMSIQHIIILVGASLLIGCQHDAAMNRLSVSDGQPAAWKDSFSGSRGGGECEAGGVKLCWCPAGRFRMGSPPDEPGRRADEAQVEVTLSKGFWMGKYEVTQGQWKRVMGAIPGQLIAGDDFPVYWINFIEAEEFCRRLTAQARVSGNLPASWEFRLPTEAQWEYACRAGTTTRVRRGGAWTDDAKFCRSALRLRYEPPRRADHIGFRVVVVQP
jgi:formylglycine-generating enzyme required for sulfatase activity